MQGWFVTGTDTGIGKTWVAVALMQALAERGLRVAGMKPVASGSVMTAEGLRNEDAEFLREAASVPLEYAQVNPYPLRAAIAPHLAARDEGMVIDLERIASEAALLSERADALVVEGVGGWRVPLGGEQDVAELAARLGLPVILVVGLRLGCINHARLTAESIAGCGMPLAGWVANLVDPAMEAVTENVRELALHLPAPLLGVMPYMHGRHPRLAAHVLNLDPLFS